MKPRWYQSEAVQAVYNYLNNNAGPKQKSISTIEKEIMDKAKVVTKKIPAYVL